MKSFDSSLSAVFYSLMKLAADTTTAATADVATVVVVSRVIKKGHRRSVSHRVPQTGAEVTAHLPCLAK